MFLSKSSLLRMPVNSLIGRFITVFTAYRFQRNKCKMNTGRFSQREKFLNKSKLKIRQMQLWTQLRITSCKGSKRIFGNSRTKVLELQINGFRLRTFSRCTFFFGTSRYDRTISPVITDSEYTGGNSRTPADDDFTV